MRYDFHAIVQTAVGFDVDMLRNPVADTQKRISIISILSALVDFKFHAEITLAVTVKYGVRLVVILVNGAVLTFLVAPVAVGVVIVIIVVGVITVDNATAAFTGSIVIVVARIAKRRTVCACIIVTPDSVTAVLTNNCLAVVAVIA